MSLSNPRRVSTRAGFALSAEAVEKLQALADWMEREVTQGQQDPRVRLSYLGGITKFMDTDVTHVSPLGALVQMYQPFRLSDAKKVSYRTAVAPHATFRTRVMATLGLQTQGELNSLYDHLYQRGYPFPDVIRALRVLK